MTNILIIEDSPTQALKIAAEFSQYDIDVLLAEDGPQGLRLATAMHPSMIVLDINLPTMNGFQVCRRLKRDPKTADIPVVMLTSAASSEDIRQGFEAGASNYIPKSQFAGETLLVAARSLGILH